MASRPEWRKLFLSNCGGCRALVSFSPQGPGSATGTCLAQAASGLLGTGRRGAEAEDGGILLSCSFFHTFPLLCSLCCPLSSTCVPSACSDSQQGLRLGQPCLKPGPAPGLPSAGGQVPVPQLCFLSHLGHRPGWQLSRQVAVLQNRSRIPRTLTNV